MSTPHKHADVLHGLADGHKVEMRGVGEEQWRRQCYTAFDDPGFEFRLVPHRWQAEIDAQKAGKAIQWRVIGEITWREHHKGLLIADDACEYRIKPETQRFRVALMRHPESAAYTVTADNAVQESRMMLSPNFRGWLGDWQEVEA